MGKGDPRTKRGKLYIGTTGKSRPKVKKTAFKGKPAAKKATT